MWVDMEKFKVGDICKIVGNRNKHGYEIGEEVELLRIFDSTSTCSGDLGIAFCSGYVNSYKARTYRDIVREIDLEKVDTMEKMKEFTKSDLQECDEVVFRDGNKNMYYQGDFRGKGPRRVDCYKQNLIRDDSEHNVDIMQVIRNKEVIWERVEKSPIQIELESLELQQREIADKIAELSKKV